MTYSSLQSLRLAADAAIFVTDNCAVGNEALIDNIKSVELGYDARAKIVKTPIRTARPCVKKPSVWDDITNEKFDQFFRP